MGLLENPDGNLFCLEKLQSEGVPRFRTHQCLYVRVCMPACMHACMHACTCACVHVYVYECMHVCMSACMHVCKYESMHACMSISIHIPFARVHWSFMKLESWWNYGGSTCWMWWMLFSVCGGFGSHWPHKLQTVSKVCSTLTSSSCSRTCCSRVRIISLGAKSTAEGYPQNHTGINSSGVQMDSRPQNGSKNA